MSNRKNISEDRGEHDWQAGWQATRRRQFTLMLGATPAERLRWLEEMIALAHRTGALPRKPQREK
jgi:hypothetical protein